MNFGYRLFFLLRLFPDEHRGRTQCNWYLALYRYPKNMSQLPGSSAIYNSANQNRCGEFLCNAIICGDTRGKKSATIQPGSSSSVSQCDMVLCIISSIYYIYFIALLKVIQIIKRQIGLINWIEDPLLLLLLLLFLADISREFFSVAKSMWSTCRYDWPVVACITFTQFSFQIFFWVLDFLWWIQVWPIEVRDFNVCVTLIDWRRFSKCWFHSF